MSGSDIDDSKSFHRELPIKNGYFAKDTAARVAAYPLWKVSI